MDKEIKIKVNAKPPVKGVDYFTPEEQEQFRSEIAASIPVPKRGIDYHTPVDIDEIVEKVAVKIPTPLDGRDGKTPTPDELKKLIQPLIPEPINGKDGYTPVKGVDYFDGKDGYTPIKGVDYDDGARGPKGEKGDPGERGPAGKDGSGSASKDYTLNELTDVDAPSPTHNQVLTYDSATRTWKNTNSSAGGAGVWGSITGTLSDQTDLQTALDGKVDENAAIVGATKTKITYDAKGLVTAGADATTADIADSLNRRYVTDAQLTVIGNTSGTNTGDQDLTNYFNKTTDDTDDITEGATKKFNVTHTGEVTGATTLTVDKTAITGKTAVTAVGTDYVLISDTSDSGNLKKALVSDFTGSGSVAWGSITGTLSNQTDLQTALDGKVDENVAITGATKTKITYDAKGLVTAGADATTADIADSTNKRYVTDADLVDIGNLSGTNTGDQTTIVGITGTKAQFDTAVTDGNFLYVGDITQYTDELAQDAVGAMVDSTLVYTDLTPALSRAALTGAITASAGSNTTSLGSFTTAQLNTALSDNDIATGGGTATGTNTGDQTITLTGAVTGSGTGSFATTIATPGTVTVSSTNSTATAHTHAVTSSSAPGAAASLLATDASGHLGSTGTRIVKGWFTDLQVTNAIAGSITGNAATVTTNANLTGHVTSTGNATVLGSFTLAQLNTAVSDANIIPEAGGTFTGDISVPDEAYGVGWNGSVEVPTKNAVYDVISTLGGVAITRTVVVTTGDTTMGSAAATDYFYNRAGEHIMTFPTAVGNTNRYTIKNTHSTPCELRTTSSQTIDGRSQTPGTSTDALVIYPNEAYDFLSNGSNWLTI